MFRMASPLWLGVLVLIPILLILRHRMNRRPILSVPTVGGLGTGHVSPALRFRWSVDALKVAALVLMTLALARPQWGTERTEVPTEGINIILAMDISESMAALDFRLNGKVVNRLDAVKSVVEKFIGARTGDRIGLVVFGTHAYTQIPLTRDYNTIASVLERIEIGAAGKSTAIGDAIGIALKRLADIQSKSNIIILLTDGQSNAGELTPESAATVAAEKKVKIYTIGVGGKGKAPFLVRTALGERYIYQEVDMDEDALKAIARKTDGRYFKAEDTEALAQIYNTIDRLEKTEVKVRRYAEYKELYPMLLLPALILLAFHVLLANTRFLKVP